ncbi:MAG: ABC transporter, permease protein 1 (cluster 5, nickel/peptides/opines) [uncultured Thermomicrobiales bacterium]|uniref:ABC transporter, permease protein 1 (Cluster 5, nickel/peptides/opines) n=1 Tax=uncultured Thermomicrobiales bacterium TaxID=1645740 RepID=A0A6J4VL73_9BACT|nr:MAG: ABC transporter, permease protein 1 (cluster 5, nickel/peptides/opines) [uncultured Thermomicrobiales bacterium]
MGSIGKIVIPRLGRAIVTLWLVVTVVFVVLRFSGDPVSLLLPSDASQQQVQALRVELGLDESIPVQYGRFILEVVKGDLGESLRFNQPALDLVLDRFPATALLALVAFTVAAVVGLGVGSLTAFARGSVLDRAAIALMGILQSAPSFFLGIMLILLFSVELGWFPTSGYGSPSQLVLPALTLSALTLASIARITRTSLLDVLRADYIRTARSKGLPERLIWSRHALRNAALPLTTTLGLELAELLAGAVIVETVFAWPGIGRLAIDSVAARDYPVVQAAVLLIATIFVIINLLVDLSYLALDPRTRNG